MASKVKYYGEITLGILFVIYLILGMDTPEPMNYVSSSLPGIIILILLVCYLFVNYNTIIAILALLVVFDMIRKNYNLDSNSSYSQSNVEFMLPQPTSKSNNQFTAFNQFPYTLEQEVIKERVPQYNSGNSISKPSYKPMVEDIRDAESVSKTN